MKPVKNLAVIITAIIFLFSAGNAQFKDAAASMMGKSGGSLPMGIGATVIDGQMYYLINVEPEVAFGSFGLGLDLNLRFNKDGNLRTGDYVKFEDYLRVIRYVRWAQKGDEFYVRVGQLDYSLLGHGSIVYNYRNSASYDLRKTGIELDMNINKFGFETMYSDLAGSGLIGMRGYVKPLKFTPLAKLPVVNNFEIGVTYARDLNQYANWTVLDSSGRGLSVVGLDLGLPIIEYPVLRSSLYFDYAQIVNYGDGTSIGILMNFSGLGLLNISGKYELRFNNNHYLPAFFNAMYEHDRWDPIRRVSKSNMLLYAGESRGYYGELVISVLGTLKIIGGYQSPFDNNNQGVFHAELQVPEIAGILLRGAFDKTNIGPVFLLDNYSILSAEVGYKPVNYLLISTLYQRTFSNRNPDGSLRSDGAFVGQNRVEPKVSIVFDF